MNQIITPAVVRRMAALSRLRLTDAELASATKNLASILNYFASIQDIDTKDVTTYDNATQLTNITREDKVRSEVLCSCATLLALAPASRGDHIQVHAVFDVSTTNNQ